MDDRNGFEEAARKIYERSEHLAWSQNFTDSAAFVVRSFVMNSGSSE